jgi:hypothetical protein
MAINTYRYNTINLNTLEFKTRTISTHIPSPKENDYTRGYIVRYFIQKVNDLDSYIYEIESELYTAMVDSPFYSICFLDWRLVGTNEQILNSNSKSLDIASNQILNIKLYLPNLLQFSKQ